MFACNIWDQCGKPRIRWLIPFKTSSYIGVDSTLQDDMFINIYIHIILFVLNIYLHMHYIYIHTRLYLLHIYIYTRLYIYVYTPYILCTLDIHSRFSIVFHLGSPYSQLAASTISPGQGTENIHLIVSIYDYIYIDLYILFHIYIDYIYLYNCIYIHTYSYYI